MDHRILITEDDPVTALFVQQMAQNLGYQVVGLASDGARALELARSEKPDVVLMDISLPGKSDGITVATQIIDELNIPVIYVTGNVDDKTMKRAISSNSYGYILKPIRSEQLYTIVEMGIQRSQLEKKLVESETNLRLLNEQLEEKVEERTHELQVNNQMLEIENERRKVIEANLKESLAREKELSELKSRVVSIISHELKTPLTTILSSAQLIEFHADNQAPTEKMLHHTQMIERSVQELTALVNDTLFLSRAEAGKLDYQPGPVDFIALLESVIENLNIGIARHHTYWIQVENKIPKSLLLDQQLVKAVLNNLMINSAKYSPDDRVVDVSVRYQNEELAVSVKDRGIGIPKEDQKYLFDLFHRASNTENIEGSGLGLAIVKRCIEVMRGSISLTSELGVGSTFTFYLPTQPA